MVEKPDRATQKAFWGEAFEFSTFLLRPPTATPGDMSVHECYNVCEHGGPIEVLLLLDGRIKFPFSARVKMASIYLHGRRQIYAMDLLEHLFLCIQWSNRDSGLQINSMSKCEIYPCID